MFSPSWRSRASRLPGDHPIKSPAEVRATARYNRAVELDRLGRPADALAEYAKRSG